MKIQDLLENNQRQHLDFDKIYGKYLKVTDNAGDPKKPGFSLVTPLNRSSWNWRERPEFKEIVRKNLNNTQWLGDHKYQQIIDAMAGKTELVERRDAIVNFVKSVLPKWPEYVVKDWIYTLGKGDHHAVPADHPDGKFSSQTILQVLKDEGLSPDSKWTLIPNFEFKWEKLHPDTQQELKAREGGTKNPKQVPRDAERHAKQAELAQKEGGIRKEPVIGIITPHGFKLMEGWHRTIQHFKQFPQGYTGPAWVAKAQSNVTEEDKFEYTTEKQILIRIRQILYDRKLSGTESNSAELNMLKRKLKDIRNKQNVEENFADGRGPGRPGDSQRHGIPKNATMAQLQKAAKAPGRKGQLARWQINMRRGRKKALESTLLEADNTVFVNDKPVDIMINPGYQRMIGLAKKQSDHDLRLLYIPSKDVVVVWPALDAVHYDMALALQNQFNWNPGNDLRQQMIHRSDSTAPLSAKFKLTPPLLDKSGRPRADTNIHRRAGMFAVVAQQEFFQLPWWDRITRTAAEISEAWTKKYKKSINCNSPKDFSQRAHCAGRKKRQAGGKTSSQSIREDITPQQKELAKNLVKLQEHVKLIQLTTVGNTKTFIVDVSGRPVVLVDFNGHTVPFYCSTGSGGKKNVPAGRWYPFWGLGADGWFNKGTEDMINNFYYSKKLAAAAQALNQFLGNMVGDRTIALAGATAKTMINGDQQPMSQQEAAANMIKYYARITTQIRAIG